MNLIIHHFKKECRYLWPRWLLWITMLIVELLLNLEWLLPLHPKGPSWPAYACLITWGAGLLLTLTMPPEDRTSPGASFRSARPLPPATHWMARTGVFAVMIGLPLVLQEAIYLILSQRPVDAVLAGISVRALRVMSLLSWAAAMCAVWQGWRLLAAAVLSVVAVMICLDAWLGARGSSYLILGSWHPGIGLVAAALLIGIAIAKRSREWTDRTVTAWQAGGCAMVAWLCSVWTPTTWLDQPTDQPRAEELAKQADLQIPSGSLSFYPEGTETTGGGRFAAPLTAKPLPPRYDFMTLPGASEAHTAESKLQIAPRRQDIFPFPEMFLCDDLLSKASQVLSGLPGGTILVPAAAPRYYDPASPYWVELPSLQAPLPDLHSPIRITAEYDVHWQDWTPQVTLPVKKGAVASTAGDHWSVTNVRFGEGASGHHLPSSITVDYHAESSGGLITALGRSTAYILHSPDRGLAWISAEEEWLPATRALASSWTRRSRSITWQGVLTHKDGTPALLDRDKLRIIVIRPRQLGTTKWTWQPPPLKLVDHLRKPQSSWGYNTNEHLNRGREQQAFDARIASLEKPGASAAKTAVLRYLWEILSAARGLEFGEKTPPQHLRELLTEVAQQHLTVVLSMPDRMASDWANLLRDLLNPLIQDQQKQTLLKQLPHQQWLAPIVTSRGWITEAVQALQPTIKTTQPINVHLRKLLLNSDDPAVRQRLLDNFRRNPDQGYEVIDQLVRLPEMRQSLQAVADELWRDYRPVLGFIQDNRLRLAIKMGNADALVMALRFAAVNDEPAGVNHRLVYDLPNLLGLPKPPPSARPSDLAPFYRRLRATDFVYRTDKLLWEKKPVIAP